MAIPREVLAVLVLPSTVLALIGTMQARPVPPAAPTGNATPAESQTVRPPARPGPHVSNAMLSETDTLRLTSDSAGASVTITQFLKNETDSAAVIECVRLVMRDSAGAATSSDVKFGQASCDAEDSTPRVVLDGWSLTSVTLSTKVPDGPRPLVGHLVFQLRDRGSNAPYYVQRPMRISAPATTIGSWYAQRFVLWTLVLAVIVAAGATFYPSMVEPGMTTLTWDPRTSWASTVGAAGGLVTVLLTVTLPEAPRYLAKPTYTLLGALFVAITALAPSIYGFLARISSDKRVLAAAIAGASAVTLWGALGQVATAWSLFGELVPAHVLPRGAAKTFQGLMITVGLLLLVYGIRSIRALGVQGGGGGGGGGTRAAGGAVVAQSNALL